MTNLQLKWVNVKIFRRIEIFFINLDQKNIILEHLIFRIRINKFNLKNNFILIKY